MRKPRAQKCLMKISLNVVSFFACSTEHGPADPKGPSDCSDSVSPFNRRRKRHIWREPVVLAGAYGIGRSLWYWPEPMGPGSPYGTHQRYEGTRADDTRDGGFLDNPPGTRQHDEQNTSLIRRHTRTHARTFRSSRGNKAPGFLF